MKRLLFSRPRPVAWPTRRRSLARRLSYALVFLWISIAAHVVLIYDTRPHALDDARSLAVAPEDDPFARWVQSTLGALLARSDVAPATSAVTTGGERRP